MEKIRCQILQIFTKKLSGVSVKIKIYRKMQYCEQDTYAKKISQKSYRICKKKNLYNFARPEIFGGVSKNHNTLIKN